MKYNLIVLLVLGILGAVYSFFNKDIGKFTLSFILLIYCALATRIDHLESKLNLEVKDV